MPKILPPTLRERNRYMTFEVKSQQPLDRKEVVNDVWNSLTRLHGEMGASKTSLWVMDWNSEKNRGILKVNHKAIDIIRSSLAMIKDVNKKPAIFHVLHTSGTLKKAREFM
jgi:ribonuclease P/MRP protein subunit POP5